MRIIKLLCILILVLGIFSFALAEETKRIATIYELNGKVEVKTNQGKWIPAEVGMILNQGDSIRTQKNSSAILNLDGDAQTAQVEIRENTNLSLAELKEEKDKQTTLLDLSLGQILIKAKKLQSEESKFEVKTPTSIVGVRGTTFSVTVEAVE